MAKREEIFQDLFFNTMVFEHILKMFKTDFYRSLIEHKKCYIQQLQESSYSSKEKKLLIKETYNEIKLNLKRLKRAEENNMDVSKNFIENADETVFNAEEFALENADVFIGLSKILLKEMSKESSEIKILPALLKQVEYETNIKINGEYYETLL